MTDVPPDFDNPMTRRLIELGKSYDGMMAQAAIEKCNCMVRFSYDGGQLPAVRHGKVFTTPEGKLLGKPISFEDMHHTQISRLMAQRNEIYIGHMFK